MPYGTPDVRCPSTITCWVLATLKEVLNPFLSTLNAIIITQVTAKVSMGRMGDPIKSLC